MKEANPTDPRKKVETLGAGSTDAFRRCCDDVFGHYSGTSPLMRDASMGFRGLGEDV
jgi:hypothetical protein